ncbi:MAG: S24 family peptidase [Chthoniobacter sp.]|uniref:S24 family peptidase n=1 Tax=Chthoniobacter sp. TaxID=2510640 RepID=UPI0032A74A32
MNESSTVATRLKRLIDEARSQKEVARLAHVSDGTLINWGRGLGLRESKMRDVARRLGVSVEWFRDGLGDEEAEIASFRTRLAEGVGGPRGALQRAREAAGLTLGALSKRTGYPVWILSQLESGGIRASEKLIDTLCRALPDLNKEELIIGSDHPFIIDVTGVHGTHGASVKLALPTGVKGRYVPLLSSAEAGICDAGHSDGGYEYSGIFALNVDDRSAFAIKVSGNSMEPNLRDGDMVICSPAQEVNNGDAAVVRTHSDNVHIKYWQRRGERVLLESANPAYPPIEVPYEEIAGAWPIVQTITAGKVRRQ